MNKIILFFNVMSTQVKTDRLAKLVTLEQFDKQGVLLDLNNGDIDNAFSSLAQLHEPQLIHQLGA